MRKMIGLVHVVVALMVLAYPVPSRAQDSPGFAPGGDSAFGSSLEPTRLQAGDTAPLRRLVTLRLRDVPLERVLEEIDRQAGLGLVYTPQIVPLDRRVTVDVAGATAQEALRVALRGVPVAVEVTPAGQVVLVRRAPEKRAQTGTIVGVVVDTAATKPVEGATITIEGTKLSALTNARGRFRLDEVPVGTRTLLVRMVGYVPEKQEIEVRDTGTTNVAIALRFGLTRLQELVTTATGQQRRLEVANQVTTIQADSIVQTQPVRGLADLLDGRVPGLVVMPTTGNPGDPSQFRLRGPSSLHRSNDPIILVDGVRIYSQQTSERSASLAWAIESGEDHNNPVGSPSAFDRIDINSIEKVEVLNGASAATLHGADAANGVILITTKKGRPGPARWKISAVHGVTSLPGRFPDSYFTFARRPDNDFAGCDFYRDPACVVDSVVAFQALNEADLTVLDKGRTSSVSATVSGGSRDITYAITGSYSDQVGVLRLPQIEADRFRAEFGRNPEDWMVRPSGMAKWHVSSRFDFKLSDAADVDVTMQVGGDEQNNSNLSNQLSALRGTYVDRTTGRVYRRGVAFAPERSLVPDFYRRTTNQAIMLTTGAHLRWQPFARFNVTAGGGINSDVRTEESILPRGLRSDVDSLGFLKTGHGNAVTANLDLGVNYMIPLGWGFKLETAVGFNYTHSTIADLSRSVENPAGGYSGVSETDQYDERLSSYGWYVAPRLIHNRFAFTPGLRFDAGSNYGSQAKGITMPKLGGAWMISEEPFFPIKNSPLLTSLRLHASYGRAGVQPGRADRLRLYSRETQQLDGTPVQVSRLDRLGNTLIRPETSNEIEGGFDAELFNGRIALTVTAYRETKNDMLIDVSLPPSVNGGGSVRVNVGAVRNTGYELSVGTNLVDSRPLTWGARLNVARNRNVVLSIADDGQQLLFGGSQRLAAGFPLFGQWDRPILGYTDANGDGILQRQEVAVGDSLVFLGAKDPEYTAGLFTDIGLFNGSLTLTAGFDYRHGFAQRNQAPGGPLAHANADPSAPLEYQALVVAQMSSPGMLTSRYGLVQRLSVLQFNSLAVNWTLPRSVAGWIGARGAMLSLQGKNLGMRTSYRGKDPLVNSFVGSEQLVDQGAMPRPREWWVRLNLNY